MVFHFEFNGARHAFSGKAEGPLQGKVRGRKASPYGRRTFTFSGDFRSGTFRGTHAEVGQSRRAMQADRKSATGTLTLGGGEG